MFMETDDYQHIFKIVVIGDSGVGKSQLLSRFVYGKFDTESKSTIGVEFSNKIVTIDDHKIKLQLWDTAGQERYRAITSAYYRGAIGILLCYDSTNKNTFDNLIYWKKEIDQHVESNVRILLISTKNDLVHLKNVSSEQGKQYAANNNMTFFETSSQNDTNIETSILHITKSIHDNIHKQDNPEPNPRNTIFIQQINVNEPKKNCC